MGVDKSFADDLIKERGIVRSRVVLLLRSTEIKPFVLLICSIYYRTNIFPLSLADNSAYFREFRLLFYKKTCKVSTK